MDYHHHARLTIYSREQLAKSVVEGRLSLREAAAECRLSRQSAAKWVRRYREAGRSGPARPLEPTWQSPRSTSPELDLSGANGSVASVGPESGSPRAPG